MIEASGLWVPIVLLLSVLGLGFMLGLIVRDPLYALAVRARDSRRRS